MEYFRFRCSCSSVNVKNDIVELNIELHDKPVVVSLDDVKEPFPKTDDLTNVDEKKEIVNEVLANETNEPDKVNETNEANFSEIIVENKE